MSLFRTTLLVSAGLLAAASVGCDSSMEHLAAAGGSPVEALAGSREGSRSPESLEGYRQADGRRIFKFPADHGPHNDFQTEWWYLTGHLDAEGRSFGFQWTLFRRALSPDEPQRASDWSSRQLYMAHFAVSDLQTERHRSFERYSRGAVGLAGAQAAPFKAWIEDWHLTGSDPSGEFLPLILEAAQDGTELSLELDSDKPMVLHGDRGFSRKSDREFGASYYYSYTRLKASGTVTVDGRAYGVTGDAWLDREWSTSTLSDDQTGWDWFSLQLDSGDDVMLFELRNTDPERPPFGSGTWVEPDGTFKPLTKDDFEIEILDRWRSPSSGSTYPSRWRLRVPSRDLELEVRPFFNDQEMKITYRYWEGAVDVTGRLAGSPVAGRGYVEMVGY